MGEKKKVGLALGGGGARGLAHIGVLKALEKNGINLDYISGTSMGSVIGALYSAEPNAKKLEKEVLELNWKELLDYTLPKCGLIKGEKIEKFLKEKFKGLKFSEVKIPLFITAYDLINKQEIIFNKGDVAKAIRASISIPGIFVPVENNGRILVDGGLTDLIPTEILKKAGADIIIAVNVESIKDKKPSLKEEAAFSEGKKILPGVISTINKSLQVMNAEASKAELNIEKADVVINLDLENVGTLDFTKIEETIKKGEKATNKVIKKIKDLTSEGILKEALKEIVENPVIKEVKKNLRDVGEKIQEATSNVENIKKK